MCHQVGDWRTAAALCAFAEKVRARNIRPMKGATRDDVLATAGDSSQQGDTLNMTGEKGGPVPSCGVRNLSPRVAPGHPDIKDILKVI